MSKYACVDVGGTFTDIAVLDQDGQVNVFKAPTTPHDWIEGFVNVLSTAAEYYDESLEELLGELSTINGGMLTHGSTIATNAIIEKKSGKVGMLCTKGFRDVLLFREGPNKHPFDMCLAYPEPFVPRYLTLPVEERINSEGGIEIALNEQDVRESVRQLREYQVEAICICFLWSTLNPVHEQRAAEIVREVWPEAEVVLSSRVNPSIREYRRFVTTAMDASLRRIVSSYAANLKSRLHERGFAGEIGMLNSSGGIMSTDEIAERPLYSIDSGPAMAPVSGKWYVSSDLKCQNVVVLDMGGTTFDVSCVMDGTISVTREAVIADEILGISRVNVHSVGAGGGSIAWVDNGGMIRVGPQSAGSDPGPACYGCGGKLPTVTDANLVLGYLNPCNFNDGKMRLQPELASVAIREHVADKLGISVVEAAHAIWMTVNANMIAAIQDITVRQGIDPRNYVMVSGGGACGLHAIALAEGMEMKRLLLPRTAGGLSAVGGIFADVISEFDMSFYTETRSFDFEAVNTRLHTLYGQAQDFFGRNGIPRERQQIEVYMEGHYPFQVWSLLVDITPYLTGEGEINAAGVEEIARAFSAEHEKAFCVKEDTYVECIHWRVKAIGKREKEVVVQEKTWIGEYILHNQSKRKGSRKVFFKSYGEEIITPVFAGENLIYGDIIQGPAIIEEPTTTILVLPRYEARVTKYNNYYIEADMR